MPLNTYTQSYLLYEGTKEVEYITKNTFLYFPKCSKESLLSLSKAFSNVCRSLSLLYYVLCFYLTILKDCENSYLKNYDTPYHKSYISSTEVSVSELWFCLNFICSQTQLIFQIYAHMKLSARAIHK